jgi:hypothetical protein
MAQLIKYRNIIKRKWRNQPKANPENQNGENGQIIGVSIEENQ